MSARQHTVQNARASFWCTLVKDRRARLAVSLRDMVLNSLTTDRELVSKVTWQPSPELTKQADLIIRQRFPSLMDDIATTTSKQEHKSAATGMLRSGAHLHAVNDQTGELIRQHAEAVLEELLKLLTRFDRINDVRRTRKKPLGRPGLAGETHWPT